MKLLPIVGRELRENSRRSATYWLRVRVAAQAVAIGIAAYLISAVNPAIKLGTALYWGVSGISMLFCLFAGRRSTVDCISQEKREGTLGLLFLTDLKGYDVVLGKLAATSVTALYALLAVFPVMAMPLLTGGMSSSEGLRMVLVLMNTFFFSVAIGIFSSSISRDYRAAAAADLLLWLALVGIPVACGFAIAWNHTPIPVFFYSCPVFSFIASPDLVYASKLTGFWASAPVDFWRSVAITNALAWLMVVLSCWIVPRTWGDKPEAARGRSRRWRWRDTWAWLSYGNAPGQKTFRKFALDQNAYFWHAARAWLKPVHVWVFIVLSAAWWLICWQLEGRLWLDEVTFVLTALLLNSTFKFWITLEAAQRVAEDRRSGAFELLLATPLTVSDMLRGQLLALRRQFLKPLVVVIVAETLFIAVLVPAHKSEAAAIAIALLVLLPDIAALAGVAMSNGLRGKNQTQATVAAAARILILPWIAFGIVYWTTEALLWLTVISREPGAQFYRDAWIGIALAADLFFGLPAWRSLWSDFRRLATQTPQRVPFSSRIRSSAARLSALASRMAPARLRIPAMAGLVIAATLGIVHYTRPAPVFSPPPVQVSLSRSNAPLRVFAGGNLGVLFVLPDGSLWRWGAVAAAGLGRSVMPEPVGTNRDWVKVVARGNHCVGLRDDGTLWQGELHKTTRSSISTIPPGSNWIDFAPGPLGDGSLALKNDGTLWVWGRYKATRKSSAITNFARVGAVSNWTAVTSHGGTYLGLRSDGTLWTWGDLVYGRNGMFLMQTNIEEPLRMCADTNWISIDTYGQARNRAGELWDTADCLPKSEAGVSAVCRRLSSDWAADHIESAPYWMNCRIRPDGTLWSTPLERGNSYARASVSTPYHQLGARTDWVSIWGMHGTTFGLTADGTVWAWGYDLGRDSPVTPRMRLQMLKDLLSGKTMGPGSLWTGPPPPPVLEEPRPLLKMTLPGKP